MLKPSINAARGKRLGVEGCWIIAGHAATAVGSLASVTVLTAYLSPNQYGELAIALTLCTLIGQVLTGGLIAGISRFYPVAVERDDLGSFLIASRGCMRGATLGVLLIGIAISIVIQILDKWPWLSLMYFCLISAVFSSWNGAMSGIQNAARQRRTVALHSAGDAWLKIALAVLLIRLFGISPASVAAGFAVSAMVIAISQYKLLSKQIPLENSKIQNSTVQQWTNKIWQFASPVSTWGVFTWLQQSSDRWALNAFAPPTELGQYAAAYQLGYAPISVVSGVLLALVAPIAYGQAGADISPDSAKRVGGLLIQISVATIGLTVIAATAAMLFHSAIFTWLVGPEYRTASYLLPWVILAGGIFSAAQVLSLQQFVQLNPKSLLIPKIVTAVIALGANLAGAYYFGKDGVVAALLAFSAMYLIWIYIPFSRELRALTSKK